MIWIIVNPVAGNGRTMQILPQVEKLFRQADVPYKIVISQYQEHAIELAAQAVKEHAQAVIAVGGDGTALEVATSLCDTQIPMGIIPSGTGNDFVKTLGIPIMDAKGAVSIILDGNVCSVDVGDASGEVFLNVAGMGFDADVVVKTEKFKKLGITGMAAYGLGLIQTLFSLKQRRMIVTTDHTAEYNTMLIAVANGRMVGGGMCVAPEALVDDGLFDVCLIHDVPRLLIPFLLPKFLNGKHVTLKCCKYFKTDTIQVKCPGGCNAQIDGQVRSTDEYQFRIRKGALKLFLPIGAGTIAH